MSATSAGRCCGTRSSGPSSARWAFLAIALSPTVLGFVYAVNERDGEPFVLVTSMVYSLWILGMWVLGGVLMFDCVRQRTPWPMQYCGKCSYPLTGNTTGQCPECGCPIPGRQRKLLASRYARPIRLKHRRCIPQWLARSITPTATVTAGIAAAPAVAYGIVATQRGFIIQGPAAIIYALATPMLVAMAYRKLASAASQTKAMRCLKCNNRKAEATEIFCSVCLADEAEKDAAGDAAGETPAPPKLH